MEGFRDFERSNRRYDKSEDSIRPLPSTEPCSAPCKPGPILWAMLRANNAINAQERFVIAPRGQWRTRLWHTCSSSAPNRGLAFSTLSAQSCARCCPMLLGRLARGTSRRVGHVLEFERSNSWDTVLGLTVAVPHNKMMVDARKVDTSVVRSSYVRAKSRKTKRPEKLGPGIILK
jgi:hypothetical protein